MVQATYTVETGSAYPGQIADMNGFNVASRVSEGAIPIGRACTVGAADGSCIAPAGAAKFVGVATRQLALQGDATGAIAYASGDDVGLLEKGRIWVEIDDTVAAEDPVFFRHTGAAGDLGKFRNDADTANAQAITSATFVDAGVSGDIVRIFIPSLL